jgi:hypothetical protein
VRLLRVAELHGAAHRAAHRAAMDFQVVTGKRFPENPRRPIRHRLLLPRTDIRAVGGGIEDHKTDTGRMTVVPF